MSKVAGKNVWSASLYSLLVLLHVSMTQWNCAEIFHLRAPALRFTFRIQISLVRPRARAQTLETKPTLETDFQLLNFDSRVPISPSEKIYIVLVKLHDLKQNNILILIVLFVFSQVSYSKSLFLSCLCVFD